MFVILFIGSVCPAWSTSVSFSQLSFNFDDYIYEDTDWGAVDFTFTGQDEIWYFNLNIGGSWQVRNIPVLSLQGSGVEQTMTYYIDLDPYLDYVTNPELKDTIKSLDFGYSFTESILYDLPDIMFTGEEIGYDWVKLWAGSEGEMPDLTSCKPLVGGQVDSNAKHGHKDFPNQEAGKKECAPTAVSNSLTFLNQENDLGMAADAISIDEMKKAVGFKDNWGSPLDTWWELKKKYMEDNEYPITTRKITDIDKLIAEIDAGQDVEIQESWVKNGTKTGHTTALIGITKLADGRYSLDIADDRKQGEAGGCDNPRTYTYDPKTGNFDELGFTSKFEYAVVECPVPEPGTILSLGAGLLILAGIRWKMRK